MFTTMHWLPNRRAGSLDRTRVAHRRRVDRNLVGSGVQERPDVVERPDSAPHRQRHEADLRRTPHHVHQDLAFLVAGRDVQEDEFVGALGVVPPGDLNRVARVAQVQEVRPLHHAALVHVQARDDPLRQHAQPPSAARPRNSASRARTDPVTYSYHRIPREDVEVFYNTVQDDPSGAPKDRVLRPKDAESKRRQFKTPGLPSPCPPVPPW